MQRGSEKNIPKPRFLHTYTEELHAKMCSRLLASLAAPSASSDGVVVAQAGYIAKKLQHTQYQSRD